MLSVVFELKHLYVNDHRFLCVCWCLQQPITVLEWQLTSTRVLKVFVAIAALKKETQGGGVWGLMFKITQVVLDWVVNIVNVSAIQKLLAHTWPHEVQKVPRGPMHHPSQNWQQVWGSHPGKSEWKKETGHQWWTSQSWGVPWQVPVRLCEAELWGRGVPFWRL